MKKKEVKGLRVVGLKEDPLKEVKKEQPLKESKVDKIHHLIDIRTKILSGIVTELTYIYPSTISFYDFIELLMCENYEVFIKGFLDFNTSRIYKDLASEALKAYEELSNEDKNQLDHLLCLDIPKEEILRDRMTFIKFLSHFIETHSLDSLPKEDQELFKKQKENNDILLRNTCETIDKAVDYISFNLNDRKDCSSLDSDLLSSVFNKIRFILGILNISSSNLIMRNSMVEVTRCNIASNIGINSDFWRELGAEMGTLRILAGFNNPDVTNETNRNNCLYILKNAILALDLFISHSPYRLEMQQSLSKFSDIIKRLVFIISETQKSNDTKNNENNLFIQTKGDDIMKNKEIKGINNMGMDQKSNEVIVDLLDTRSKILDRMCIDLQHVYPSRVGFYDFIDLMLCRDYRLFIKAFLNMNIPGYCRGKAEEALRVYEGLKINEKRALYEALTQSILEYKKYTSAREFQDSLGDRLLGLSSEELIELNSAKDCLKNNIINFCRSTNDTIHRTKEMVFDHKLDVFTISSLKREIFNTIYEILNAFKLVPSRVINYDNDLFTIHNNNMSILETEKIPLFYEIINDRLILSNLTFFGDIDSSMIISKEQCIQHIRPAIEVIIRLKSLAPYAKEIKNMLNNLIDLLTAIENTLINSNIDPFYKLSNQNMNMNHNMMNQMNGVGWGPSSSFGANMPQYGMSNNNMMCNPRIPLNGFNTPELGRSIPIVHSPLNNMNIPSPMNNCSRLAQTDITFKELRSMLKEIIKAPHFITLSNYINENEDNRILLDEMIKRLSIDIKLSYESALKGVDFEDRDSMGLLHCLIFETLREEKELNINEISSFDELNSIINKTSKTELDNLTILINQELLKKLTEFLVIMAMEKDNEITNQITKILITYSIPQESVHRFIYNEENFKLLKLVTILYIISRMKDIEVDITVEDKTEKYKITNLPKVIISENEYIRREPVAKLR